jgi:hypothetical protein
VNYMWWLDIKWPAFSGLGNTTGTAQILPAQETRRATCLILRQLAWKGWIQRSCGRSVATAADLWTVTQQREEINKAGMDKRWYSFYRSDRLFVAETTQNDWLMRKSCLSLCTFFFFRKFSTDFNNIWYLGSYIKSFWSNLIFIHTCPI